MFINTGKVANRGFMIKSYNVLQTMSDDSTDIAMNNFQKRYVSRPVELKNVSLADWFLQFVYVPPTKKILNGKRTLHTDDESIEAEETEKPTKYELSCRRSKVKDFSHYKIIRYVRYSLLSDRENHFRELIMLFYPFENESEICEDCASYEDRYTAFLECVETKRVQVLEGQSRQSTDATNLLKNTIRNQTVELPQIPDTKTTVIFLLATE